jgi:RNA polymerase sigma-70 factor (ECF subfamily)
LDPQEPSSAAVEVGAYPHGEDRSQVFRESLRALDRDVLGRFYELYAPRVYHYVRRMLGEDQVAEDLTQDIFMHIQRSLPSYDSSRELSPWVYTLATNKVRDYWRSRRSQDLLRERSIDELDAQQPITDRYVGPVVEFENRELGRVLSSAIDDLPEGLRATLLLRYFEGLSFEAIASVLELNEDAVRKRYSRALAELRRVLQKPLGLTDGGRA